MKKRKLFLGVLLASAAIGLAACNNGSKNADDSNGTKDVVTEQFTVTFDSKGGSTVAAQTVDKDAKATQPTAPTKTATAAETYTFAGWYTDEAYTTAFDFNTGITANITLYAKWTPSAVMYTVTFNVDGGTTVASQSIAYGGKATRPDTDPTKSSSVDTTKYEFAGWYKDAGKTQLFDFANETITSATTIYAKWTQTDKVAVTFDTKGGNATIQPKYVFPGEAVSQPTETMADWEDANNSYTFVGWYTSTDGGVTLSDTAYNFATQVTGALTLYAKWTATPIVTYQVTFDVDGGTTVPSQTIREGRTVTEPTVTMTKQADAQYTYTFAGWYADADLTQSFDFGSPITSATTIYAKWSVKTNEYTITFISNGDTNVESKTVSYGSPVIKPNNPVRSSDNYYSYSFRAWSTSNFTNDNYDFNTPITGALTLYGWWAQTPIKHSIIFNSNGGTSVDSQSLMYGDKVTKPSDPTKAEDDNYTYTFAGWYTTSDFKDGTEYNFDAEITGPFTLYAKWTQTPIPTYAVTFDTQGGSTIASQTVKENGKATEPTTIPTKTSDAQYTYTFAGWYKDAAGNTPFDFNTETITRATTIYAKWSTTPVKYTVTFNSNGGTTVSSLTIAYGGKAAKPPDPTKTATELETYTFAGWYKDSSFKTVFDFNNDTITSSITLYAKWTATPIVPEDSVTIGFGADEGLTSWTKLMEIAGVTESDTGKTSLGKSVSYNGFSFNSTGHRVDGTSTTSYVYNSQSSTITFTLDSTSTLYVVGIWASSTDGKVYLKKDSTSIYTSSTLTKLEDLSFSFELGPGTYTISSDKSIQLTKLYLVTQISDECTVTFNSNGGTAVSSQTIAYGEKVSKPTDPTKAATELETYTFGGWYKNQACTQEFNFTTDTITSSITLYAKWTATPITYEVKYYNGEQLLNTEIVNAGSIITYDPPVFQDYNFSGWYTDSSFNNYFENNTEIYVATTLYAKYEPSTGTINVTSYKGYTEGIHIELEAIPGVAKTGYIVSYKSSNASSYTTIDNELIRIDTNVIIDIIGLTAGTYSVKIDTNNETLTLSNITVTKDDRSGYAHFNYTDGVGAYNDDGTLKSNAVVVYVTDATKNTVTATFGGKTYTGLYNIINNSKSNYPLDIRILGDIGSPTLVATNTTVSKLADKNYDVKVMDSSGNVLSATKQENTDGSKTEIVSGGYGTYDNSYTKLNGLTSKIIYGTKTYNKITYNDYDSYFNMMDISKKENITIEGIGADATITQWGFTWSNCSYIEVKNITFNNYPEDACSFQGSNTDATTLSGLKTGYIWIHNNTFNIGKNDWDVSYEQDKHEGDGATDIKGLRNATISYNHYYKNHKTGLLGGDGTHHQANITFHHNWYQENQARLPYGRQANMHMYNNFYDSSTGTNMQIHDGGYAFIENCYFKKTSKTFEVKTNKTTQVPAIKSYNNIFDNCKNYDITNVTITTNRTEVVSNDCLFGSSFDTDSSLFYYKNGATYVEIMNSASELPTLLPTVAGAGLFAKLTFN